MQSIKVGRSKMYLLRSVELLNASNSEEDQWNDKGEKTLKNSNEGKRS